MKKFICTLLAGLLVLFGSASPAQSTFTIAVGTVSAIGDTTTADAGASGQQFDVVVQGSGGWDCDGLLIEFKPENAPSAQAHQRHFAMLSLAMSMGFDVIIVGTTQADCKSASAVRVIF